MGLPKLKDYWTVEEYLEFEKTSSVRHEYVDGEIYAMAGESKNHNRIAGRVYSTLDQGLAGSQGEAFIENDDDYVINDPVLIVEVLSKSAARTDRNEKLREYKSLPNLCEYVIISQSHVQIEIYQRQEAGENWTKLKYSDLQSEIHFDSIRIKISLADIYRRVRFSENILEMEREERQEREER